MLLILEKLIDNKFRQSPKAVPPNDSHFGRLTEVKL